MIRLVLQSLAVVTVVSLLTYLTDRLGFRSAINILWMVGFPVAVAVVANRDAGSRCLVGLGLVILGPVTVIGTAALLGLGA